MSHTGEVVQLLEVDPDLAESIPPEKLPLAQRSALARVDLLEPGEWRGDEDYPESEAEFGLLVLDGYLSRAASYASVIFRSRFAEDALDAAIARGVRQYVQIGAGFDSYVLRRPPHARDVQVFEVDHPATQTLKLQRLSELYVTPVRAEFIAADLARESIVDALRRSGFQFDKPAFFSWLGVTMYLTREANLTTLRAIAGCCKPESSVVFTYTDELGLLPGSQSAAYERMKRNVAALGEPFLSGFDPQQLSAILAGVGFVLKEDLSGLDPISQNNLQFTSNIC